MNKAYLVIRLSKKKWWDVFYNESKRFLKPKWAEKIKDEFEKRKPRNCHCSLKVLSNRVVHSGSKKYPSSSAFTGEFKCLGAECQRAYKFERPVIPRQRTDGFTSRFLVRMLIIYNP